MSANQDYIAGQFLVAMPSLAHSFFDHALIYMLDHNEEGAMGLIINQPMDISVDNVLVQLNKNYNAQLYPQPVLCGGPVESYRGFVLHRSNNNQQWQGAMPLPEGIYVTASADILDALIEGRDIGDFLIVLGYSGWAPGQLEQELADNAWLTVKACPDIMFNTDTSRRLEAVTRTLGISYSQLSDTSGHA